MNFSSTLALVIPFRKSPNDHLYFPGERRITGIIDLHEDGGCDLILGAPTEAILEARGGRWVFRGRPFAPPGGC